MKTVRKLLPALAGLMALVLLAGCKGPASPEEARKVAEDFVRSSATFRFDGMEDTLRLTETLEAEEPGSWTFVFEYDSRHAGYGDRTGRVLAQVITHHQASVTVSNGQVVRASLDDRWDMLEQREMSGGTEPGSTGMLPPEDFTGRVTSIEAVGQGQVLGVVMAESETDPSQKYAITVTGKTDILGPDGQTVGFNALEEGQEVRVWFSGPVKESFPMQVDAGRIIISRAAGER